MNKIDSISHRIKYAMDIRNKKQAEIVAATGIGKSSLSQYISGKCDPKADKIYLIADALSVSEAWLMGYDAPMERDGETPFYVNLWNISDGLSIRKEVVAFLKNFDEDAIDVLFTYIRLNEKGKERLKFYITDLLMLPLYTETPEEEEQFRKDTEALRKALAKEGGE